MTLGTTQMNRIAAPTAKPTVKLSNRTPESCSPAGASISASVVVSSVDQESELLAIEEFIGGRGLAIPEPKKERL